MRRSARIAASAFSLAALLTLSFWSPASMQSPTSVRYAALGDSLAAGVGANVGYVERYRSAVEAQLGVPVQVSNFGCSGCTSGDLLALLQIDPRARDAVAQAQIVTWDIGGNDLLLARRAYRDGDCGGEDCLHQAVDQLESDWDAIVSAVMTLTAGHSTVIMTMDVYDPFMGLPEAGPDELAVFQPYLDEVNDHITTSAEANGIVVVPAHDAFNGPDGHASPVLRGLMAQDIIHPNDMGYQLLAGAFLEAGRDSLDQLKSLLGG